jgi:hypothetical protein
MDVFVMEKGRIGFRWCRLLEVETIIAVYVSCMLLRSLVRGPICATATSLVASAYFVCVLIGGGRQPEPVHRGRACRCNPFTLFCWCLALVEVLVYSRIRYP